MENKKLEEMTAIEIKALVYDQMAAIEQSQTNVKLLNEELRRRPAANGVAPHVEVSTEA